MSNKNGLIGRQHKQQHINTKVCQRASLNIQHMEPWSKFTTDHWKNVSWSDDSWFLPQPSDGRVRIWYNQHENMDPSSLVWLVQAFGVGVIVFFLYCYRNTIQPTWVLLLSIPLWPRCTYLLMAASSRIINHVPNLRPPQGIGLQTPDLIPVEHF